MSSAKKQEFIFDFASIAEVPQIVDLMQKVKEAMPQKEWFVADDAKYLLDLLAECGFILLAKTQETKELAGFLVVKYPGLREDNLGYHFDLGEEELKKCVHMDSCVVHPKYRGHHLQSAMATFAEQYIPIPQYRYLLATVHPENCYSLQSMLRCGYRKEKSVYLYGGLPRAILVKELF